MAASKTRRRADALLAERGLAPSRSAAAASVRAGQVRIGADGHDDEHAQLVVANIGVEIGLRRADDIPQQCAGKGRVDRLLAALVADIERARRVIRPQIIRRQR
jgi:hypothetical protein